jgi:hypothetical protein
MAIHTSAITYSRGIPKNYTNFFFVAQTNNTVPAPLQRYLRYNSLYNRNIVNNGPRRLTYPWRN